MSTKVCCINKQPRSSDVFEGGDDNDLNAQNETAAAESEEGPVVESESEDTLQKKKQSLEADLAEAKAPDVPLAVENASDSVPSHAPHHEPAAPEPAPTAPPQKPPLPGPPLPPVPKGKKGHHMPHVVTMRHVPQTLVTQVHGTTSTPPPPPPPTNPTASSISSSSAKTATTSPSSKTPTQSKDGSKKNLHKCKECGAEFKADWRLFKHITSVHDDSEYAKEAIFARENTIQENRRRLRSSQKSRKNDTMSSETPKIKATTGPSAISNTDTLPKTLKKTSGASSKVSKTSKKVNAEPYPKKKPVTAKTTKTSKAKKSDHAKEEPKVMDQAPPDLVRSRTAAGKKRSVSVSVNHNSAPKRKSGTLAVSAPSNRGAKRSKSSMFVSTLKRPKLADSDDEDDHFETYHTKQNRKSKRDKRYGDASDDEYDDWKY